MLPSAIPPRALLAVALAPALLLAGCVNAADFDTANEDALESLTLACADPCGAPLTDRDDYAWEPHAVRNPGDPDHLVVAAKFNVPGIVTFVTRDGGASWTEGGIPAGADAPDGHPFRAASHLGDPVLAALDDGTVLLAGLAAEYTFTAAGSVGRGSDVFVARSTDGGLTFPDVVLVAEGEGRRIESASVPGAPSTPRATAGWLNHDKEWLTVAPDGTLLLAWVGIEPATPVVGVDAYRHTLLVSTSRDAGATWTAPAAAPTSSGVGAPFPVVTASGAWHVAFHDWRGGLHLATSRDAGDTWNVERIGDTASAQPVLRALPDRLLLAYAAPGDPPDVQVPVLRTSTDDGASWSEPLALATPTGPGDAHPALDVGADGTAFVAWYDHAEDGTADYRVAAVRDGTAGPALTLATDLEGPADRFGHYVTGVMAGPGGASAAWVQPTDDGRTLVHARVTSPD